MYRSILLVSMALMLLLNVSGCGSSQNFVFTTSLPGVEAPATLVSLSVTPNVSSIALGTTQQFTATATFDDGSNKDVTTVANWTSSQTSVSTVGTTGRADSIAPGQSTITATFNGVAGTATLAVTNASITGIELHPPVALSAPGSQRQYKAIAQLSNGERQDVTSQVEWSSNNTQVPIMWRRTIRG